MIAIAAVTVGWGIGCKNVQSPVLPEDRRHFLKTTSGGIIIAGRKTFEEIGRPLPERKNIILTRDNDFKAIGVVAARSVDEALALISGEDPEKTFVIGGGAVYEQFMPMCSCAHITKIEASPPCDTFFPNLDELPGWSLARQGDILESAGIRYSFNLYINNAMAGG